MIYKNKIALIIGGDSDIGMSIAQEMAKAGCNLILTSRKNNPNNSLSNHLKIKFDVSVENLYLDILSYNSYEAFIKLLNNLPDFVFITIGYLDEQKKSFQDIDNALLSINTNFVGPSLFLNRLSSKLISNNHSCQIIAISSVAGLRGRGSNFIYGSSKAGFIAYLSGLRNYLFNYNVKVLTVLPGFVDTKMTAHLKLPRLLTISPEKLARKIIKSLSKNNNVIYSNFLWRLIMTIIGSLPEIIFKRLKL